MHNLDVQYYAIMVQMVQENDKICVIHSVIVIGTRSTDLTIK